MIFRKWYYMFKPKMHLNWVSLNEFYDYIQEKKFIYQKEIEFNYQELIKDLMSFSPQCEKDRETIRQFLLKRAGTVKDP